MVHERKGLDMNARTQVASTTNRQYWFALVTLILGVNLLGCGGGEKSPSPSPQSTTSNATPPRPKPINSKHPLIRIDTSLGQLTLTLDGVNAPGTVRNFLNYASEGFYDDTIFHYVQPEKMIVCGGYTSDRRPKPARSPIRNEAHNGLKNVRGTIAMTRDPSLVDSATSQFFINLADAPQRDHQGDAADQYGYCVFGTVTAGLEIADKISQAPIANLGGDLVQTPDPPVLIKSIRVVQ
jgi:peptidyl-prolyl cis-trans isomerase A (cyclophilin A)